MNLFYIFYPLTFLVIYTTYLVYFGSVGDGLDRGFYSLIAWGLAILNTFLLAVFRFKYTAQFKQIPLLHKLIFILLGTPVLFGFIYFFTVVV